MPKKITNSRKNRELCHNCDACCRYIAVEIDRPSAKRDYQDILWFLLHKNVGVYIGHDRHWYLEISTPCLKLKNKLCSDYEARPEICREYHQRDCTRYNNERPEKIYFSTADDFKKYLAEKNIKL